MSDHEDIRRTDVSAASGASGSAGARSGQRGSITGRVVRTQIHKNVAFMWCWCPPDLVQCVVAREAATPRATVGAFVTVRGRYVPYGGRRADCHRLELAADSVEVLAVPEEQYPGQGLDGLDRSRDLFARGVALRAAQTFLDDEGLMRVELPIVVGAEATGGATAAFRVRRGGEHAFLTVNSLVGQHEYLASGYPGVFQTSRLYWAHHSSDRSFLNEINLIEYAVAGAGRQGLVDLTERLMEHVRLAISRTAGLRLGTRPALDVPLSGLPVLTHAQAVAHAARQGMSVATRHVIPRGAARAVAAALGAPGFWLVDPPSSTTPFYVRAHRDVSGSPATTEPTSVAADLYLSDAGETASGSEWVIDPREAHAATGTWGRTAGAAFYNAAVGRGVPPHSAGMSLGIDRLLMYLLGNSGVRSVRPASRRARPLRQTEPVAPDEPTAGGVTALAEPYEPGGPVPDLAGMSRRVSGALRWLVAEGFLPCMTGLLTEPWLRLLDNDLPVVDYFGHDIALAPSHQPEHHRHLAQCPAPVFELGPVAGAGVRWTAPRWTLDVSLIRPGRAELDRIVREVITALLSPPCGAPHAAPAPEPVALSARPLRPQRPGYFAGSLTGRGLDATAWYLGDRVVARAGTWLHRTDQLPDAFGAVADSALLRPLREFLRTGPPPAGGVTIEVTDLPTLTWPSFPMRATTAAAPARPTRSDGLGNQRDGGLPEGNRA